MRAWWVCLILLPLTASSGCLECEPERIAFDIDLHMDSAEARTLPILASGATKVGDLDLPDSHGVFTFSPQIDRRNTTRVSLTGLDIRIEVGGQDVDFDIVHTQGLGSGDVDMPLEGTLREDRPVSIWWRLSDSVSLPEGTAYTVHLEADWILSGCAYRASGTAYGAASEVIKASAVAQAFGIRGKPDIGDAGGGKTLDARFNLRTGIETKVDEVHGFLLQAANGPGVAAFPAMELRVDGVAGDVVAPGQQLEVSERLPVPLTPPAESTESALVVFIIHYSSQDGTPGAGTDVVGVLA